MAPRKKPVAKKPVEPQPDEQQPVPEEVAPIIDERPPAEAAPIVEEKPAEAETAWVPETEPVTPVNEEVIVLATTVRAYRETRDVRFELALGVICMFGYGGLARVLPAHQYRHIATVQELEAMSDQQIYDAVMEAGKR